MRNVTSKTCVECQGAMSPIIVMDNGRYGVQTLEYRRPDDSPSFWTGKYPTAGRVLAMMCGDCGRIALYGAAPDA